MTFPRRSPMLRPSLLALSLGLGFTAPAAGSVLNGFYKVHQFCSVSLPSTKTVGVKRELHAQVEEGDLIDPENPGLGKLLAAQIIDEHRHLKVTYEGHTVSTAHQTPEYRAFTEFKPMLEACFALEDHQEIAYAEWLKLIGTSPNTLVSDEARSTLLRAGESEPTHQKCKYLFERTKDPEVAEKFKGPVPLCPGSKTLAAAGQ